MAEEGDRTIAMPLGQMLFGLTGRIRRRDFWLYSCGNLFVALVADLVYTAAVMPFLLNDKHGNITLNAISYGMLGILLPFIWVALALNIKRLHDIDKSYRWWRINLIPVLGWAWTFFECGLRDGTPGPNRYGLSPKGICIQSDVF